MQDTQIIKLVFGIALLVFGLVPLLISFFIFKKDRTMKKRCTMETMGIVDGYHHIPWNQNGVFLPHVLYTVHGEKMHVTGPLYRGYVTTSVPSKKSSAAAWVSKREVLHLNYHHTPIHSTVTNPICDLFPIGTKISVFYDPDKPKRAYVQRYLTRSFIIGTLATVGIVCLLLDVALQLLI